MPHSFPAACLRLAVFLFPLCCPFPALRPLATVPFDRSPFTLTHFFTLTHQRMVGELEAMATTKQRTRYYAEAILTALHYTHGCHIAHSELATLTHAHLQSAARRLHKAQRLSQPHSHIEALS